MSGGYSYGVYRERLFTDAGQKLVLAAYEHARRLLRVSGAATMEHLMGHSSGDLHLIVAAVERLAELGYLREVGSEIGGDVAMTVAKVYVAKNKAWLKEEE